MTEKINWKEKGSIIAKAGISALPCVGGALATLLFDYNTELRIKRLEKFYSELVEKIEKLSLKFPDITIHDEESLVRLLENLNENIEKEFKESKINYFQNYFINTLSSSTTKENFDEREYFLNTLSKMNELECELLALLRHQNDLIPIKDIQHRKADHFLIVGAINNLKSYGFVSTIITNFIFNSTVDTAENESVIITDLGKRFSDFVLSY